MALDPLGGTEFEPYNYQDALKRRLRNIGTIGEGQSQRIAMQQQLKNMATRASEMEKLSSMNPTGSFRQNSYGASGGGGGGNVEAFIRAIAGQESGGNYGARNPSSGAMGKYQIMPANLGGRGSGWDYEALGRDISPEQFMSSPELQEAIARHMMTKYYNQYGPQGAAAAWYGGPGVASNWQSRTGSEGAYPSIANYVRAVMARMQ